RVAEAPAAAPGEHATGAVLVEVGDDLPARGVLHERPRRHLEEQFLRRMSVLVAAAPRLAVARPVFALEAEVEERRQPAVGLEDDVGAIPAVSTRGTAPGNVLLPAEGDRSPAAVTRFDVDLCFVDELHGAL